MYNIGMKIKKGRIKGFTLIEVMLFLALTGLMLVGALIGIGSNLARQRYKDSVQDVVSLIRNQYDYVTRVQIDKRDTEDMCKIISGTSATFIEDSSNIGRGRSLCDVYGVALFFGLENDDPSLGSIVQSTSILGIDINTFEDAKRAESSGADPAEIIASMSDQELLQSLMLNNIIERAHRCEAVGILSRKVLNWGSKIEDVVKDRPKKGIVLIIRSPRDGTVHTFAYDFSEREDLEILDYTDLGSLDTTCAAYTAGSVDINSALGETPPAFKSTDNFDFCITSEDLTGTYGKRRMIRIKADGHNSSAVSLIDEDSEENLCQ